MVPAVLSGPEHCTVFTRLQNVDYTSSHNPIAHLIAEGTLTLLYLNGL